MEVLDTLVAYAVRELAKKFLQENYEINSEEQSRTFIKTNVTPYIVSLLRTSSLEKIIKEYNFEKRDIKILDTSICHFSRNHEYSIGKSYAYDDGHIQLSIELVYRKVRCKIRISILNEFKMGERRTKNRFVALATYSILTLLEQDTRIPIRNVIGIGTSVRGVSEVLYVRRIGKTVILNLYYRYNGSILYRLFIFNFRDIKVIADEIYNSSRVYSLKKRLVRSYLDSQQSIPVLVFK